MLELREALIEAAPEEFIHTPPIVADLVPPGEMAILVVPIDMEAPKGRLIQPQVQTIRDLLDGDAYCMVVKERELRDAFERLRRPPALVVTDSQAFLKVAADTPPDVKMTSFSILFARQKGDLRQFVEGAMAIEDLRPGDRVLLAEACTHHPIGDDIGRVKIPRWLKQYVGGDLAFDTIQGHDFPDDLSRYKLMVHCGACMWNRREMLTRMLRCRQFGLPVANYGMTIAYTLGIFQRALGPFPDALEAYREKTRGGDKGEGEKGRHVIHVSSSCDDARESPLLPFPPLPFFLLGRPELTALAGGLFAVGSPELARLGTPRRAPRWMAPRRLAAWQAGRRGRWLRPVRGSGRAIRQRPAREGVVAEYGRADHWPRPDCPLWKRISSSWKSQAGARLTGRPRAPRARSR